MWETLVPWIIMAGVVVLTTILYLALNGKLGAMGEFIRNFLRFKT